MNLRHLLRVRKPKDTTPARLVGWDPVAEREADIITGPRWLLQSKAARNNEEGREYVVRPTRDMEMHVWVLAEKSYDERPKGFDRALNFRFWTDEIEAGGALAAFEHKNPGLEGKYFVKPATIKYRLE